MYPRNAASPERVSIGAVVQISDGAVQTSGVSIKVKPQGTTASAGGGTTSYEEGIVEYLPTQAETNYTSFEVIAYKTGCIPVSVTVVTTASATPGYAGVDWSKVTAPTTTLNLSGTTVKTATDVETDTADIQSRIPAALVSGRMDASVGAMAANVMTAAAAAADLTTELQTGLATSSALATLQSAVDVVDGIVDAILVDTAVIGAAGAGLTAVPWNAAWDAEVQSEAADALAAYGAATSTDVTTAAANVSVDEIQATALADLFNTNSGTTYASAVAGSVVKEIVDNAGGSGLTAGAIADAVWDEAISGHATSGSTGEALSAAGGAGDPWITALPGSYSAGQAGKIVGDYLNASVSSRATQTSVDTVDTVVDSILVDTNELQTDWANGGRLDLILDARASQTSVDDLPTNAELATALGTADDATLAAIAALSIPSAATIADAVWDEATSGHVSAGSTGLALGNTDLRGSRTVIRGTSATGASTTSLTPSALSPAGTDADQFKGRILVFDNDTTTAALRGQATDITASSAASLAVLTFTALTTAPASGDTFSIV